jgi:hypothetical protein
MDVLSVSKPEIQPLFMQDLVCYAVANALLRGIKIANRSFGNVSQFKYLGIKVANQNLIQQEIKRRLSLGNACYHSVQSLLSSRLLSKI